MSLYFGIQMMKNVFSFRTKNTENKNEKLNEFDKIWKYTYNLRQQRRLDDANRLEQIGEKLWTETTGEY